MILFTKPRCGYSWSFTNELCIFSSCWNSYNVLLFTTVPATKHILAMFEEMKMDINHFVRYLNDHSSLFQMNKDIFVEMNKWWVDWLFRPPSLVAAMSLGEPTSDSTPFFSDDSEAEGPEEHGRATGEGTEEESASGVSRVRGLLTVSILCYVNLLNYMDRFTVAGTIRHVESHDGQSLLLHQS